MEVDKEKQLFIKKVCGIITFKDRNGNIWHVTMKQMRALVFGGYNYIYANPYKPNPEGRPKGYSPKGKETLSSIPVYKYSKFVT